MADPLGTSGTDSGVEATVQDADCIMNRKLCERMDIPFLDPVNASLRVPRWPLMHCLAQAKKTHPEMEVQPPLSPWKPHPSCGCGHSTGIHADTGQALGQPLAFDLTVTLGRWKTGLLCAPGCELAGDVYCVDIGLDLAHTVDPSLACAAGYLLEQADVDAWRPTKSSTDAKWDRGHVAILANGGAAVLAAHGAFRSGAGLVHSARRKANLEDTFMDSGLKLSSPNRRH